MGSVVGGRWSVVGGRWGMIDHLSFVICHLSLTECYQLGYSTNNQQPTTNNQQPTTNNQQPTTNTHQPTTNNQPRPLILLPEVYGNKHQLTLAFDLKNRGRVGFQSPDRRRQFLRVRDAGTVHAMNDIAALQARVFSRASGSDALNGGAVR